LRSGKSSIGINYVTSGAAIDLDCRRKDSDTKVFLARGTQNTLLPVDGSKIVQHGQRFVIYNFTKVDNGEYKCAVLSSDGRYYRKALGEYRVLNIPGKYINIYLSDIGMIR